MKRKIIELIWAPTIFWNHESYAGKQIRSTTIVWFWGWDECLKCRRLDRNHHTSVNGMMVY